LTPDPAICPECGGTLVEWFAGMALACQSCHGKGHDGPPRWSPQSPPPLPPVWADPRWNDPELAMHGLCRFCLGGREIVRVDEVRRSIISAPCPSCAAP
jgi:hypothetical protein